MCSMTKFNLRGDQLPQTVTWPGYGFSMEIPAGAIPSDATAKVSVKVMLTGQFEIPVDTRLASALYWIYSEKDFLEPVSVNIQHCMLILNEAECARFKFIIARCDQEVLPYRFKEREGLFSPYSQYATIKLKRFSIVGATAPINATKFYVALKFYKPIQNSDNMNLCFIICNKSEAYTSVSCIVIM